MNIWKIKNHFLNPPHHTLYRISCINIAHPLPHLLSNTINRLINRINRKNHLYINMLGICLNILPRRVNSIDIHVEYFLSTRRPSIDHNVSVRKEKVDCTIPRSPSKLYSYTNLIEKLISMQQRNALPFLPRSLLLLGNRILIASALR